MSASNVGREPLNIASSPGAAGGTAFVAAAAAVAVAKGAPVAGGGSRVASVDA